MPDALVEAIKSKFDTFFDLHYTDAIGELIVSFPDKRSLMVDIKKLSMFDPELASELVEHPDGILEAANESLKAKMSDVNFKDKEPHVRFFGQTVNQPMVQDVGSNFISKLISLDALIVKRSEINPKVKIGSYK